MFSHILKTMIGIKGFAVAVLFFLIVSSQSEGKNDLIKPAMKEMLQDYSNEPCTVVSGSIPSWLSGHFVRQTCGSIGSEENIGSDDYEITIEHFFDCISKVTTFKFDEGNAMFSDRFYDTRSYHIWSYYNKNLTKSHVAWNTPFSKFDRQRSSMWKDNFTNKYEAEPNVNFMKIGDKIEAVTEQIDGMLVKLDDNLHTIIYPFKDVNLGYPESTVLIDRPAHESVEKDGTLWSVTGAIDMRKMTAVYAIYSIKDDYRKVVAEYPIGQFDLSKCTGAAYPDLSVRMGYMHSIAMTKNYIIIPVTSLLLDYCNVFAYKKVPFFMNSYTFEKSSPSLFIVMRKSDSTFVANITVDAMFVAHQINAYEKNGLMYLDMLTYDNADVYFKWPYFRNMIDGERINSKAERFVLDMKNWTLKSKKVITNEQTMDAEFPTVNWDDNYGEEYTYVYMVNNVFGSGSGVMKLNVETKEEKIWKAPSGFVPQEPIFVASPDSEAEDDGVILVGGPDTNTGKGFVSILHATNMTEMARIQAPGPTSLGLHNRFYKLNDSSQISLRQDEL